MGYALGAISDFFLGRILTDSGPIGYVYAFSIAGSVYLFVLLAVHMIMPKMTPLDEDLKN